MQIIKYIHELYIHNGGGVNAHAQYCSSVQSANELIMATSVPFFSLVNATSFSNCSRDIVEESCVVHQADVSSILPNYACMASNLYPCDGQVLQISLRVPHVID